MSLTLSFSQDAFVDWKSIKIYFLCAIKLVAFDFEKFSGLTGSAESIEQCLILTINYNYVVCILLRKDMNLQLGAITVFVILV